MFSNSRFNPTPGIADFWNEFRKPNPYRWPILLASSIPVALILYWATSQTAYKAPERPEVIYITTFDPDRSDADIVESNLENQELKELRAAKQAEIAERKRELYKALGAAAGMDVEKIEREADARRVAEEAAEEARRAELFGRDGDAADTSDQGATP